MNSFPTAILNLLQIFWLKATPIYYLRVSVGKESKHGFAGFSAQGITKLKPSCYWASVSSDTLTK